MREDHEGSVLEGAIKRILEVFHERLAVGKDDSHHVDPHAAVVEAMPVDIGGGELRNAILLVGTHRLGWMAVSGVAPRANFHKHHRPIVEGDDVDIAP